MLELERKKNIRIKIKKRAKERAKKPIRRKKKKKCFYYSKEGHYIRDYVE